MKDAVIRETYDIVFAGLICLKISRIKIYYFTHIVYLRNIHGRLMSIQHSYSTFFTVACILCPTVLNKPLSPFGISSSDSFSVHVCNNNVFFYGYLPLAQQY